MIISAIESPLSLLCNRLVFETRNRNDLLLSPQSHRPTEDPIRCCAGRNASCRDANTAQEHRVGGEKNDGAV